MNKFGHLRLGRGALALALALCCTAAGAQQIPTDGSYQPRTAFDNAPWRFDMEQNGKRMTAAEFDAWMVARGVRVVPSRGAAPASTYQQPSSGFSQSTTFSNPYSAPQQAAPQQAYQQAPPQRAPQYVPQQPYAPSTAPQIMPGEPGVITFGADPAQHSEPTPSFVAPPLKTGALKASPAPSRAGPAGPTKAGPAKAGGQSFVSAQPLGAKAPGREDSATPGARVSTMSIKVASNPAVQAKPPQTGDSMPAQVQTMSTQGAKIGKSVIRVANNSIPAARLDVGSALGSTTGPALGNFGADTVVSGNMAATPLPEGMKVGSVLAPPTGAPRGLPPGPGGMPPTPPPIALPDMNAPPIAFEAAVPEKAEPKVAPGVDTDFMPLFSQAVTELSENLDNGMAIALFKTDDPMFKAYAAGGLLKVDEETMERLTGGLASTFARNGKINNATTPVCYVLYQPSHGMSVYHEFIAPISKADSPEAAARFLVAHEVAHCLDNYERELTMAGQLGWGAEKAGEIGLAAPAFARLFGKTMATSSYSGARAKLFGDRAQRQYEERLADLFAVGWLRKMGTDPKAIDAILATRERLPNYAPHNTAVAIPAGRELPVDGDLANLWQAARAAQRRIGVDPSLDVGSEVAANPNAFPTPDQAQKKDDSRTWKIGPRGLEPVDGGAPAKTGQPVGTPRNFNELPRFGSGK